jgi:hypothetical protein
MDQDHHPLAARWREEAQLLRRCGAHEAATTREACANELETHEENHASELLTLDEAARESGYHKDSISRMITEEKIPNAGTKGAPRVRRRDLPKKPPSAPPSRTSIGGPNLVGASLAHQGIVSVDS